MAEQSAADEDDESGLIARATNWFDTRLGLSHPLLRPAPTYAISPFYWLGALAVVAFVIQAVTGMLMMLYYVPDPAQAYTTTQYIFQNVSYGRFLESVHLYTAYAMIMLAFMHMMRGYFVSVHRSPRELMWVSGMFMGLVTLGMGFTGYLLPWTVISKLGTDVGAGMITALPQPLSSFLTFLIVGGGGAAGELLRFFDLHVVVLPAILLILLVVKMYMLEVHGISEPVTGQDPLPEEKSKPIPIFPSVSFYLVELAALFGAAMLVISVLFPVNLPPAYSAATAGQYVVQPDWYFLWIYQTLKIALFEANGPLNIQGHQFGLPIALSLVTLVFILLILLPFVDRSKVRRISRRPIYVTLGLILAAEIVVLTIWGYLTPAATIPDEQAAMVLGGTALAIVIISLTAFKLTFGRILKRSGSTAELDGKGSGEYKIAAVLVLLLGLGAFAISGTVNALSDLFGSGVSALSVGYLSVSGGTLAAVVLATAYTIYKIDSRTGSIRRRIRIFDGGPE